MMRHRSSAALNHSAVAIALLGGLCITLVPERLAAQDPANHAVYAELLGSGGLFSVNYERRLGPARARVGIGRWEIEDLFGLGSDRFTAIPVTLSYVSGARNHHFESGGGVTFGFSKVISSIDGDRSSDRYLTLSLLAGYRYQKPGSGFVFRALLTPLYGIGTELSAYPDRGFFPSVGLSAGYAF